MPIFRERRWDLGRGCNLVSLELELIAIAWHPRSTWQPELLGMTRSSWSQIHTRLVRVYFRVDSNWLEATSSHGSTGCDGSSLLGFGRFLFMELLEHTCSWNYTMHSRAVRTFFLRDCFNLCCNIVAIVLIISEISCCSTPSHGCGIKIRHISTEAPFFISTLVDLSMRHDFLGPFVKWAIII